MSATGTPRRTGVALAVHAPETTRNGEFFEIRFRVEAAEPIGELVIGVEDALWEDVTVNTMIPAATEEESADGEFRFVFSSLEAGTPFLLKLDLLVNQLHSARGRWRGGAAAATEGGGGRFRGLIGRGASIEDR